LKKLSFVFLAMLLMVSSFPVFGHAATKDPQSTVEKETFEESLIEMQEALKNTELEIDLETETNVEKVVYNNQGEKIGTMGIEEVPTNLLPVPDTDAGIYTPFATTLPKGKNQTFKVYWYTAFVNYWFYTTVKVDSTTGKGQIVSAYDQNYIVIPPGVVTSDLLSIVRKNETATLPAEARYTLNFIAPVSTKLWIYGRVQNGKFTSGGN
jgi:hypothetical protein